MKNKDKIIILKAKVIKLKEQLKAARLELADTDNEWLELKNENSRLQKIVDDTKHLWNKKGYIYCVDSNGNKKYFNDVHFWGNNLAIPTLFNSFEEFKNKYAACELNVHFEPIQQQ